MTFTLHTPCTMADLAEVIEQATAAQVGMFRAQMAAGSSFALRNGLGVAVACFGVVEMADGRVESWFAIWHRLGGTGIKATVGAITLTLERLPYPEVHVVAGTPAGRRMALLAGFVPEQEGAPHEIRDRLVWRRQGRRTLEGGSGGGAAALAGTDGEGRRGG